MIDLPGIKPSLGLIASPLNIRVGNVLTLSINLEDCKAGSIHMINMTPEQFDSVKVGHKLWLDDGAIQFDIERKLSDRLICRCVGGRGLLTSNRSIVFPDSNFTNIALSPKDMEFLSFFGKLGSSEEIAISFARHAETVLLARSLLNNANTKIIAKIENAVPMEDLIQIATVSDKLLLARGDLSMSISHRKLFTYQAEVISFCVTNNIPLIIGTGLFASLSHSLRASIAECNDANYIISSGVSCFLISDQVSVSQPKRALLAIRDLL